MGSTDKRTEKKDESRAERREDVVEEGLTMSVGERAPCHPDDAEAQESMQNTLKKQKNRGCQVVPLRLDSLKETEKEKGRDTPPKQIPSFRFFDLILRRRHKGSLLNCPSINVRSGVEVERDAESAKRFKTKERFCSQMFSVGK